MPCPRARLTARPRGKRGSDGCPVWSHPPRARCRPASTPPLTVAPPTGVSPCSLNFSRRVYVCAHAPPSRRFGGPGIKKKACLRRVCHKLRDRELNSEDEDEAEPWPASTSTAPPAGTAPPTANTSVAPSEPPSEKPSPPMRPRSPTALEMMPPTGGAVGGAESGSPCEGRPPLHEVHGGQLEVLSSMALQAATAQ